ncbi:MAG: hypothetical protein NT027_06455, partial [Proteobacteria bacterium]|nr:hypothetical protein [Pseudomonadota bacterium]
MKNETCVHNGECQRDFRLALSLSACAVLLTVFAMSKLSISTGFYQSLSSGPGFLPLSFVQFFLIPFFVGIIIYVLVPKKATCLHCGLSWK